MAINHYFKKFGQTAWSHMVIIIMAYAIISIFIFSQLGVKYVNDSPRYLEYAKGLREGFYFDPHNFWYLGYVLFISLLQLISSNYLVIIFAQYVLGFVAVIALYKTSIILFSNRQAAFFTALIYLAFVELITWHSYLLAESMYVSLICISFYFLSRLYREKTSWGLILKTLLIVIVCWLAKPTGIAVFGAFVAVLMHRLYQRMRSAYLKLITSTTILFLFLVLINKMLSTFLVIENYQLGEVIYGVKSTGYDLLYPSLVVEPPNELYIPPVDGSLLIRMLKFILHQPVYCMNLFLAKLLFLLGHVRPYWSLAHNVFSLLFLLPIYLFLIIFYNDRNNSFVIKLFSFVFIGIQLLSVGLTSEDWDGRFLMPLLPMLFLLSAKEIFEKGNASLKKYLLTSNRFKQT